MCFQFCQFMFSNMLLCFFENIEVLLSFVKYQVILWCWHTAWNAMSHRWTELYSLPALVWCLWWLALFGENKPLLISLKSYKELVLFPLSYDVDIWWIVFCFVLLCSCGLWFTLQIFCWWSCEHARGSAVLWFYGHTWRKCNSITFAQCPVQSCLYEWFSRRLQAGIRTGMFWAGTVLA